VRDVRVQRLQCDEIWSFVGSKQKNTSPEKKAEGWGDVWTWIGLDADTKLCLSFLVGGRDATWAHEFMQDCASRIKGRVQLTTDGHKPYLEAVESAFGGDIDYAQLIKIYGAPNSKKDETRYSPAECLGCKKVAVTGNPLRRDVSTSYVERYNLTLRTSVRRLTRLTNGFSKKFRNHAAMIAIQTVHYNFVKMHKTLRCTPAMAADLETRLWSLEDMIVELDRFMPKLNKRGPYKKRISN
jgi:IS1 family transposase